MRDETVGAFVIEFIPWETYGMKARISGLDADGSTCGYCAAFGRVCELHRDIWQRLTRLAKEPIEPEPQPEPQPEKRRRDDGASLTLRDAGMAELRAGGMSVSAIAARYRMSTSTVQLALARHAERVEGS